MLDQSDPQAAPERLTVADIEIERLRFRGGDRPLLFLHPKDGPGGDAAFLSNLAGAGFDVHAPWLPGFGHSERPDGFVSVRDLACFAQVYMESADMEDAVVVGASFGGWVAAEMATRDVNRFARLVLIDALGMKFAGRAERDIADFHSLPAAELRRLAWASEEAGGPPQDLDDRQALALARSEEAFALYGWRPYMHDPGLGRWLERVRLPVRVIWGAQDGVVAPDYGRAYAGLFANAEFHLVEAAGHYPTRERPEHTAGLVAEL